MKDDVWGGLAHRPRQRVLVAHVVMYVNEAAAVRSRPGSSRPWLTASTCWAPWGLQGRAETSAPKSSNYNVSHDPLKPG